MERHSEEILYDYLKLIDFTNILPKSSKSIRDQDFFFYNRLFKFKSFNYYNIQQSVTGTLTLFNHFLYFHSVSFIHSNSILTFNLHVGIFMQF